jgi:hypothetical protein
MAGTIILFYKRTGFVQYRIHMYIQEEIKAVTDLANTRKKCSSEYDGRYQWVCYLFIFCFFFGQWCALPY